MASHNCVQAKFLEFGNNKMKKLFIIFLFIGIILSLAGCNNQINNLKLISADKQVEESDMIRNPAVAGSFYPNDKTALIDQVNGFLTKAKKIDQVQPLRILLVPHAGWDYSGQVAGWGFKQLSGSKYSKVILLGSSHQAYFANGAVYSQGAWQTPIGKVAIDQSLASS